MTADPGALEAHRDGEPIYPVNTHGPQIDLAPICETEMKMNIEFLGMKEGCPNTPRMWASLQEALHILDWNLTVHWIDLSELSDRRDNRAGFGSPTVLVNGSDLFGATSGDSLEPSCRYYSTGVPGTKQILEKLVILSRNLGVTDDSQQ
jgi:hypothetical protein